MVNEREAVARGVEGGSEGKDSSGDIKLEWKRNSEKLKRVCLVWNNS